MRWGVPDEAQDDHMTVDVCLNEIRNCQKVSIGPNFMVRYSKSFKMWFVSK